ncbi:hypothetical protein BDR22DRAFT_977972 [Usnea florida]
MAIDTDPSTQQHAIVVVCIVAPALCSLFVAMRVWTRTFVTHSLGWDDYAGIVTLPFAIAYSVIIALGTNYGFGWHTADLWLELLITYKKWDYASSYLYLLSLLGYKFSILLLYLRLFSVSTRFRYSTWAAMFFVFGYLVSNLVTQIFGCMPIQLSWEVAPGHCYNRRAAGFAFSSMNIISDLLIFVLPMPMVWRLRLSRKGKLGVMLVFMGGGIAFAVAVVRYGLLLHMLYASTDQIWLDGKNLIWMVLEVNTGLICSCTPALKPFLDYCASGGWTMSSRKHNGSPADDVWVRQPRRAYNNEVFDGSEVEVKDSSYPTVVEVAHVV